jgi:UbiD family decarboxylase
MRAYIDKLIQRNEMRIVKRAVDPRFELAAVVARSQQDSSLPVLFETVQGSSLPVVSNVFGSSDRLCELIGAERGQLCQRWAEIMKVVDSMAGPYTTIVLDPPPSITGCIGDLPQIVWREKDCEPYISAGVFLAKNPESGIANLSFCRSLMKSDREMICCIDPPHDLAQYQAKAEAKSKPLDVCILIGPPPEIFIAACASVPIDLDEIKIAAAILGEPIQMQRARTVDLEIPVGTQVVIEGRIRPGVREPEGPFGEFMGYYGTVNNNGYIIDVTDVYWQPNAVFHGLLCGTAEDLTVLDIAFATRTYNAIAHTMTGILDVTCNPMFFCTVVKIQKTYEGQAQHVMLKVFAANPNYNFACIVVDRDVDTRNLREVFAAYLTRGRLDKRIMVLPDVRGFDRAPDPTYCGRVGIDATMPLGREAEFERATTPGADTLRLADYLT